jgi:hypothetical protein
MGIKLDWQVESEQTLTRATEEMEARQRRRRALRQFILLVIGLMCVVGVIVGAMVWRLLNVDNQLRQDLIDTVQAEVTALRIGNLSNYMDIQRSASDAFIFEQTSTFEDYQTLKQANRIQLTGEIINVTIDDQRGRVILREIIDGIPYDVLWFYWYYEDPGPTNQAGWRRVPDDLTFWGDERQLKTDHVTIDYRSLDRDFAEALADRLDQWIVAGCATLNCDSPPPRITVELVAERPARIEWSASNYWTLTITSPFVDRARSDVSIAPEREANIARGIAGRLLALATQYTAPPPASDAAWLREELERWLGDSLRAAPDPNGFIESLIALYGPTAPQAVLDSLPTASTLDSVVTDLFGNPMALMPIEQIAALNWESFFQWRLNLESRILNQPEIGVFLDLYDQNNTYAAGESLRRQEDPAYATQPVPQVQTVTITRDAQSQTYAYVDVIHPATGSTDTIIWRLFQGTWKRTS